MKKYLFIILLTFILLPNLNAECDYTKEVELSKLASNINYTYEYDKEHNNFTINIYNVNNKLFLMNNSEMLYPSKDNNVIIENVNEGQYLSIAVKAMESCYESLITIYIIIPYFNEYYNSVECNGYEDKIKICSDEFLSYDPTINLLQESIKNYNNSIPNKEEKEEVKKDTIVNKIENFTKNWGIKIGLSLFTTVICIIFFQSKIRKIKHGL